MNRHAHNQDHHRPSARAVCASPAAGVTLTEVLMAMLIMSIGVVSVATLFPISVLRTVEATHLTNATLLRYNAESRIAMSRNSETFSVLNVDRAYGNHYLIDPLRSFMMDGPFGALGAGATPKVLGVGATPATLPIVLPDDTHFFQRTPTVPDDEFGIVLASEAAEIVSLPDSWVTHAIATPAVIGPNTITLPAETDLTSVPAVPATLTPPAVSTAVDPVVVSRVVFFDQTSRTSQVRSITDINTTTNVITWDSSQPLPAGLAVGEVWVQSHDRRYTWMLTVRRLGRRASVDVVTFSNRAFSPEDEVAYPGTLIQAVGFDGVPGDVGDDDSDDLFENRTEMGTAGSDDQFGADGLPGHARFDDDFDGLDETDDADVDETGWPGTDDNRTLYGLSWDESASPARPKPYLGSGSPERAVVPHPENR